MNLIYDEDGSKVVVGDIVEMNGREVQVIHFVKPHKPSSSGKMTIGFKSGEVREVYVGVIGATWVDREDR